MSLVTSFLGLFKHDTSNDADLNSNFDIDTALNENWDKIDAGIKKLNDEKVSQVSGKSLSTNDFTNAYKTKLDGVATGAQANVLEGLTLDGKAISVSSKKAEIKDAEVTNARKSTIKNKTFSSVTARIEELEENVDSIETVRGHIYGVRRKITNNTSTAWERIKDSVGLVANATKNGGSVVNNFDNLAPWSEIKSCNYDIATGKVKAWFGDATFSFDGSNGDVYTYIPDVYLKIYQEDDYDYILISDIERSGFTKYDSFFIARYAGSVVDDVLHSYSGLAPAHNKTIAQFRTLAKALGDKFSLLDYRYFVLQMLYLVEYATYNSQSALGNGVMTQQQATALIAESNTNRVVVSSTTLYVGRTIGIGSAWASFSIATDRKVTKIEDYSNGGVTGKSVYFDGDPVNIAVGNVIWGCGQHSGQCDNLGMKSGCLINDGYHSVVYRGIENLFSNMWQFVDGITIQDRIAYICKDHSAYENGKITSPYKKLGYTNGDTNGYVKNLGFDPDEPLCRFPVEVGGSSSSGTSDYYYQNTGTRLAHVGGYFSDGAIAGLWYWNLGNDFSYSSVSIGCRVLIDNQ
ncbi:MAG: hypothetical protein IJ220_07870 [Clostridia bacterium]|nr:hypothetical protein [Clostridia bacterium]